MTTETAYDTYLGIRARWDALLSARNAPMRSPAKDALYGELSRAWTRLTTPERTDAGVYCKQLYHA